MPGLHANARLAPLQRGGRDIRQRLHWFAAGALALLFVVQALHASRSASLTWDEPGYIAAGYANLVFGDYRLNLDHPPLLQKLQALPLLFLSIEAPRPDAPRFLESENPRATYGRELVFRSGNDVERITRWARAPGIVLGALLVLCVYGFAKDLFGPAAALLPTALTALSPSLVAHGGLATEDLGCSALMLAAVWSYWRAVRAPGARRAVLCGVVTGLALLTKYTALLLAPIYLLLLPALCQGTPVPLLSRTRVRDLAILAGIALAVVGLGYGARFRPDLYLSGVLGIYPDRAEDYVFYFWGRVSDVPLWYHGAVSILFKAPLPALLLLSWAALRAASDRGPLASVAALLVPPVVIVAASFFDITNPGVRRVLPALPFLLIFTGFAARGLTDTRRLVAILLLLAWSGVEAARVHPHQLSYLNTLAGGAERGPWVFDESNVDWGQDLPALASWQRQHLPGTPLRLLYFGSAYPDAYGVEATPFDLSIVEDPPPGTYAISAHYLVFLRKLAALDHLDADWLSSYQPIGRAGYSIYLYRFPAASSPLDAGGGMGPRPSR